MAAVLFLAAVLALMEMLNKVTGIFFIRFSSAIDDLSVPRALYVAAFRLSHPLATTSFLLVIITLSII